MRVSASNIIKSLGDGCVSVPHFGDFDKVLSPGVNTLLCPQAVDLAIDAYCQALVESGTPLVFTYEVDSGQQGSLDGLHQWLPVLQEFEEGREAFLAQVEALWAEISRIELSQKRSLRFEKIESDMCRLFHGDKIRLRLLCSYLGAGTEWLPNTAVAREFLGSGCNDSIVKSDAQIYHLAPFEVGIFKGDNFPGNQGYASVHRSPQWQGNARLLLKIDSGTLGS